MSKGTGNLKSFNYLENGKVTFSVFDTVKTVPKLDIVKQFGIDKIMDIDSYGLNAVRSMGFTRSK